MQSFDYSACAFSNVAYQNVKRKIYCLNQHTYTVLKHQIMFLFSLIHRHVIQDIWSKSFITTSQVKIQHLVFIKREDKVLILYYNDILGKLNFIKYNNEVKLYLIINIK